MAEKAPHKSAEAVAADVDGAELTPEEKDQEQTEEGGMDGQQKARQVLDSFTEKLHDAAEAAREAGQTDGRGGGKVRADGTVGPYEILSNVSARAADAVKEELIDKNEELAKSAPYVAPLDRRREALEKKARRVQAEVEADDDATGVALHKDSAFNKRWKELTENSKFVDWVGDQRLKYEESENVLVRGLRVFTDKFEEMYESAFVDEGMKEALTEINRLDPSFELEKFNQHCERVIFPAVLEAELSGDLAVLKDWCSDRQFSVFEMTLEAREKEGLRIDYKIQDLSIEAMYKGVLDDHNNPFFIYLIRVYKVFAVRDRMGEIIEGSEDDVDNSLYIVGMRRDGSEIDPQLAWSVHEWGILPNQE